MKKLFLLLALVIQGFTQNINANIAIEVRLSTNNPPSHPVGLGELVPVLSAEIMGSGAVFMPSLAIVVQQRVAQGNISPIEGIYIQFDGGPEQGPYQLNAHNGPTVVGSFRPITGEWTKIKITTLTARNTDFDQIGLSVVGVIANDYHVNVGEKVNYIGDFPLRGENFPIDRSIKVESLLISEETHTISYPLDATKAVTLGEFKLVAGNGDVKIPSLPIKIETGEKYVPSLQSVSLVNESGETVVDLGTVSFETKDAQVVTFKDLVVPQGTNHWTLKGVINNDYLLLKVKASFPSVDSVYGVWSGSAFKADLLSSGGLITIYNPSVEINAEIGRIYYIKHSDNANLRDVIITGTKKPNTGYNAQVSTDLKSWKTFGRVKSSNTTVMSDFVGTLDNAEYGDSAFIRLVEQP